MKNYLKKCLAIQNKKIAIASTFLRGKYKWGMFVEDFTYIICTRY